jgi:nicotinamide riboside kinase
MKKIVLTGPESSGKTTLAAQLAQYFGAAWVPEFARQYLDGLGRPYLESDLLEIARGQAALEDEVAARNDGLIFLDTSLEVVKIWSEVCFGRCAPEIRELMHRRLPDFYLLCLPDLPWVPDPQRQNPNDRDLLLVRYQAELASLGVPFSEVRGSGEARLENAVQAVNLFVNN